jgi:DNA-directed RNA polymerase specialized sigma subunit
MTVKEVQKMLLYHNKGGFSGELQDLYDKITDLKASNTEMSGFVFKLAVPQNKSNSSTVEVSVMKNLTVLDLEMQARDIERFIKKLDWVIDNLPKNEQMIIKLRYFSSETSAREFRFVAADANFSEDWCERLDKRALQRISEELCGVRIVWNS